MNHQAEKFGCHHQAGWIQLWNPATLQGYWLAATEASPNLSKTEWVESMAVFSQMYIQFAFYTLALSCKHMLLFLSQSHLLRSDFKVLTQWWPNPWHHVSTSVLYTWRPKFGVGDLFCSSSTILTASASEKHRKVVGIIRCLFTNTITAVHHW